MRYLPTTSLVTSLVTLDPATQLISKPQRLSSVEMAAVRGKEELVQVSQQQLLGPTGEGCQVSEAGLACRAGLLLLRALGSFLEGFDAVSWPWF